MPGTLRGLRFSRCASLLIFLAAACSPASGAPQPMLVGVHASSAAYPWISGFYACAGDSIVIKISDSESAEISVQLGEPVALTTPAYEIGMDDVLVVVHPQTGVGPLTLDQVRSIFSGEVTNWHEVGGADLPVEVWTYATGEDIQRYFDGLVLQGRPIASTARLAVSAQNMSDSVGVDPGAVGFLPEHWKTGNTREALNLGSLPVLAIVNREPQGAVRSLLACLQTLGTPSP